MVVSSVTPLICLRRVEYHFGSLLQRGLDGGEQLDLFLAARVVEQTLVLLGLGAQVQQQGGVAAVVQDHVGLQPPSGHSKILWVYSQYSLSVSPFKANTGVPFTAMAAAAWSCVE